jgi:hypothetical protein
MLEAGRKVILQDAAFWRQAWPDHELFGWCSALNSPEQREFEHGVLRHHHAVMADMQHVPRNSFDQVCHCITT